MRHFNLYIRLFLTVLVCFLLETTASARNISPKQRVQALITRAENGSADDQLRLSNCYAIGYGVERDTIKAIYWKDRANENGVDYDTIMLMKRGDVAAKILIEEGRRGRSWKSCDSLMRDSIYDLYYQLIKEDDHSIIADHAFCVNINEISLSDKKAQPIIDYLLSRADEDCLFYIKKEFAQKYAKDFLENDEIYINDYDKLTKAGKARVDIITQLFLQSKDYIGLHDFYTEVDVERYETKAEKVLKRFIKEDPEYGCLYAGTLKVADFFDDDDEKKEIAEGIRLLRKSEQLGSVCATGYLGLFSLFGLGVESDPETAVEKLKKAADKMPKLYDYLGYCYHNGIGTTRNDSLAYDCWKRTYYYNPFTTDTYCPYIYKGRDTTFKAGDKIVLPVLECTNPDISSIVKRMDWDTLHHFVQIYFAEKDRHQTIRFENEGFIRDSIQGNLFNRSCVGMFESQHTTYLVYGDAAKDYFMKVGEKDVTLGNDIWWLDGVSYQYGLINKNRVFIFDKHTGNFSYPIIDYYANVRFERMVEMDYRNFKFDASTIKRP